MSHELHDNLKIVPALAPVVINSNTVTSGLVIDRAGFEQVELVLNSGILTDGSFAVALFEGEAANLSDASAVAAGDLIGTLPLDGFALTDDGETHKLGYKGVKRYIQVQITSTGVAAGGIIGGVALLGGAHRTADIVGQG